MALHPAHAKDQDLANLPSPRSLLTPLLILAIAAPSAPAIPPTIERPPAADDDAPGPVLPKLRQPLPPPKPMPVTWLVVRRDHGELLADSASLRARMLREVAGVQLPSRQVAAQVASRAVSMLGLADQPIDAPQLVLVVDRNPAVQRVFVMLARPGGADGWRALGDVRVSTGQAGRKDHYITPLGVFAHTAAILDYRAQGTFNENHVRGLGNAGMRVWDFGWQWALKGWHTDGEGGEIRLEMHATDPDLLERRLGHPASEGCVRLSSSMNRFLDMNGVLDADYERQAVQDVRYRALLAPDRTPTPLAGRFLVVIDSGLPVDAPPTAASRPADWPSPDVRKPEGDQAAPGAPGTDTAPDAPPAGSG